MYFIILILAIIIPHASQADIFKCIKNDGSIYYYDRACHKADLQADISKRDLVLMRYDLQQKHQELLQAKKLKSRQEIIEQKQKAAELKRRLRLDAKCETVALKIAQLNKQYKQGYNVKQGQVMDAKLAECNNKRRMYCKNEQAN